MAVLAATLEHNGVKYDADIVTIDRTTLGYEDHGVFMAHLHVTFGAGGSGTAIGGIVLDGKPPERISGSKRPGTAYGHEFIIRVIRTVVGEYGSWEQIKGSKMLALFEPGNTMHHGFECKGIANLEGNRVFIFDEISEMD